MITRRTIPALPLTLMCYTSGLEVPEDWARAHGAALLHFIVLDGLLHPQISWLFHLCPRA